MNKTIKNPELYAHKIRGSFQKFLGYYQHSSVLGMDKEKMRRSLVDKANEVIKASTDEITFSFNEDVKNQTTLRLVRVFNKEKEVEIEGKKIREKYNQLN